MSNYIAIENEISSFHHPLDIVRHNKLENLSNFTGRNTIAYYSGFIPNSKIAGNHPEYFSIEDNDINHLMSVVDDLDKSKGLDLILHTPGGELVATEAIVNYLKQIFGNDIRAIIPQIAMSAGTMIALSCKSIVMGKHSSIGPIDPSIGSMSVYHIIKQFEDAKREIIEDINTLDYWSLVLRHYGPTTLEDAILTRDYAKVLAIQWLNENMFSQNPNSEKMIDSIMNYISERHSILLHSRHIPMSKAKEIGLVIEELEENQSFQDHVLAFHHSVIATFKMRPQTCKIIQNNFGVNVTGNIPINSNS